MSSNLHPVAALVAMLSLAAGCAAGVSSPSAGSAAPSGLPLFPLHGSSVLTETLLAGVDAVARSGGAVEQGTELNISSPAGIEWAVYHFNRQEQALDSVSVLMYLPECSQAWIGLSDFAGGSWRFSGPYTKSKTLALDDGTYTSPTGELYVAVVVDEGSSTVVNSLSLRTSRPNNEPPVTGIEADIWAGPAPLTVTFTAAGCNDPDGEICYYLWDFESDGEFEGATFEPQITHTFFDSATYMVTVTVIDDGGAQGIASMDVIAEVGD